MTMVFTGAHTIIGSADPDADRAFFRDVLGLPSVDAGGGWLIFSLPPSEVAVHPGKDGRHELYLMCGDLDATVEQLKNRGAQFRPETHDEQWGRLATIVLPGGGDLSIYEPRHRRPPQVSR